MLKARMNVGLHMADDLKNTGKSNSSSSANPTSTSSMPIVEKYKSKPTAWTCYHPNTGEVRSGGLEGIACWFIDTDYNEESFFVRHAYFLGANDPYKPLKTTLKAEINEDAWISTRLLGSAHPLQ